MPGREEAPLLIDFYSSGELDAVMTTLQIVQEYGTAVSCVSAPKTSNQKGNKECLLPRIALTRTTTHMRS